MVDTSRETKEVDDAAPGPDVELPHYESGMFANPDSECDIVMKGGITSGIVYPYAILELARKYRFRSIGGTSAGGIAASFAAAAEYARTIGEDPAGFIRLKEKCDELPDRLRHLFQPQPRFASLMRHILRSQNWKRGSLGWALPIAFPFTTMFGALIGGALLWRFDGAVLGIVLGTIVGIVLALGARVAILLLRDIPSNGFGLCTGLTERGGTGPGLTDWMYDALQYIAFGTTQHAPLTFGDLAGSNSGTRAINLKMVTTNLSMQRPHTLPAMGIVAALDPAEWRSVFPQPVVDHLREKTVASTVVPGKRDFPAAADLPVIVATRMSLSFPFLFTAIPLHTLDFATSVLINATGATAKPASAKMWFADGGISSNFPIHMFDSFLPERPTFALSLDSLPAGAIGPERVFIPDSAGAGVGLPVNQINGLAGYAASIISSAKDWQDQLLSTMPGHRELIAHVMLSDVEGGLNLTMPPARSRALMERGFEVGSRFAGGALDFDDHRWRRALVTYDQLEDVVQGTDRTWQGGYGAWLKAYLANPASYKIPKADRIRVHDRLGLFAALAPRFNPVVKNKRGKLPNPRGRLTIDPDY